MISSEKEVLEIKDFYKSILDNIINGVWVTNADDIIYYTNKGMENIAGIPAKQIIGSHVLTDFPESTLKYFRPHYLKAKDTLKSVFYDIIPVSTPSDRLSYQSGWLIPRIKEGKYDGIICTVDDITERKEAEEKLKESEAQLRKTNMELDQRIEERTKELKESEEKYRNLVENAQEGIWALDEYEDTIFINQKICEMLGYTRSEMMGKNLHSFIPDSMKELIENNRSRRERGEKETYDLQLIKKDGIIIYTNVKAAPIMDENHNYKGSFAYITDITQRKIAEQELDISEIKYRTIFEEALNPILIIDENGTYIDVNKTACEFLESNKEEILRKVVWDYTPPHLLEEQKKSHVPFYARRTLETEYLVNGKIKTLLLNVVPFEVAGKKLLYGIGQNITDRLIAKQKLKESEEKFRSIFEHAALGIALVASEGSFIKVNQKFCRILKYSQEELLSLSFPEITHPVDLEESIIAKNKLLDGEILTYSTEKRYICKDESIVWVNLTAALLRDSLQKPKYFIMIIEDISNKKELEEERDKFFNLPLHLLIISGLDGIIKRVNPGWTERLGYEVEELEGKNFLELVHPDDRAATIGEMGNLSKGITTFNFENRYQHKNGTYRTLAWAATSGLGKGVIYAIAHDVTERKKAEQKLKESEEKYRLLAKNINDVIWIMDFNLKTTYISPSVRAMFDYTVEEDMALPFTKKFTSESVKKIGGLIKKHITPKNIKDKNFNPVITMEVDQYHKDGSIIPCEITVNSMRDKSGAAIGLVGITRNIAKRKETEKKLKESEEKYRTLFENSPYAVGLINTKGVVIQGNSNIEKVFGYKKEEFIGQNFNSFPLFSREHKAIVLKNFTKLIKGEIPEPQELQLHKKDGNIIWISMQPSIVKLKNETLFQVITQDISKIKEAELKLKQSEGRYRLLFESSPVGIGIFDFEGNVYAINNAMEKITGYNLEEYQKVNLSSTYVDPHDRSKILDILNAIGRVENYEVQLKRIDEFKYHALLNIELEEIEKRKYLITCVQDITELKLAEEKLKDLNKLKSELLRRTSHELKTPLVSIKGFSDLLLELHREKLDDYLLNTIEEIKKGCIRLEALINDILKTAELESDVIQINKIEEDLSFLIKLCISELKGLSKLRKHKINLNIPDRLIASFEKEQLHQVISNLLNNAIKYTPPNGEIEINSEIQDEYIIISIKDNGIGLIEEAKDRVFKQFGKIERFGQGYDVMSEGSGLGLYISKKIIELHGGQIWVESEGRNKGSTFYFSLPIEDNRQKI